MSGYVASARLGRPAPRLVRRDVGADEWSRPIVVSGRPAMPAIEGAADLEPLGEPDDADGLAERWTAVRERWTQLTFYLFDSNSWR